MDNPSDLSTDLDAVAKQLNLPLASIQATIELLDEGNTVPFVTRYRKDSTGGLDEEQIRAIQTAVDKQRQLNQRKQKILKSIQSQDKLTDELTAKIQAARSLKALEDLYLPFKPKKQTLATIARQRGLEPLALEVLNANPLAADFKKRCEELIDPEKELATSQDVETGVRHLLAEYFSEQVELRSLLRRHLWAGKVTSKFIERSEEENADSSDMGQEHAEQLREMGDDPEEAETAETVGTVGTATDSSGSESGASEPEIEATNVGATEAGSDDSPVASSPTDEPPAADPTPQSATIVSEMAKTTADSSTRQTADEAPNTGESSSAETTSEVAPSEVAPSDDATPGEQKSDATSDDGQPSTAAVESADQIADPSESNPGATESVEPVDANAESTADDNPAASSNESDSPTADSPTADAPAAATDSESSAETPAVDTPTVETANAANAAEPTKVTETQLAAEKSKKPGKTVAQTNRISRNKDVRCVARFVNANVIS